MSLANTHASSPRESEAKQIDHNGSIRSTYLSMEELKACGAETARTANLHLPAYTPFDFFSRHKENDREILRVYRSTAADVAAGAAITPAAEWLLDNHYVVEEALQEVRRDFPRKFYRQLPVITVAGHEIPRTLAIAWLYVAHTHSTVSRESLTAIVDGFQEVETLKIGELWALPSMVRYVLIENLRRISIRVERSRKMRRLANEAADELIRLGDAARCRAYLGSLEQLAEDNTFATQFLYRLRDGSQTSSLAIAWLEERLERAGTDAEEVLMAEHNRLSSGNVTMGNIIKGLREIDDTEWAVWVEDVSQVDRLLFERTNYGELDPGSRNKYRRTIERMARRSGQTELEIAATACEMTASAGTLPDGDRPADLGDFLVGTRRKTLEKAVGYSTPFLQGSIRKFRKFNWFGIAGPVLLFTLLALWGAGVFLAETGMAPWAVVLLLALFALPASEGATGLFNTLVTFLVPPVRLIGYEFKDGIPDDARTLLVVPCLISSRDSVDELIRNLEVHYLSNPHGAIHFALLSDWPDSQKEESEADLAVFAYARQQIDMLGRRYSGDREKRFFLLHRRRLYNPQEGCWMGWERKRGKLHELNLLLRGDRDTSFLPGANEVPEGVQYVMTLDSDTRLMRDAVTKLVGKLHHPINRPVLDPVTRRVVEGYGLLQPRVTASLTTGVNASVFQRIFSINRGLDPYVFTVSDVYQDLTGEGTFTGKGLYHVDAFEAALKGRIDENAVLSHDLLEGSMARCALVTDVELVEDFPIRYEVEVSRQHRWARGDWQLLPFILEIGRGVTALGRWKMIDNLRRSLIPIAWFIASLCGWCLLQPFHALAWQVLLIFCLFVAPTLSLINGLIPRSSDIVARAHLYTVWSDIRAANAQVALRVVFIADSAVKMADAIIRSLYRLFVSRKYLLEWKTAASVQSSAQGSILDYYKAMWQAVAVSLAALLLAALSGPASFLVGLPFVFLWVVSPAVAWYVSQTAETEDRLVVSEDVSTELRKIARRTWRYFETFVNAEQNFLPPDNFQETPHPVLAKRTSPTNIGVYLLSVLSARQFGWISFAETIDRIEQTVSTIDRMEKFRGHLLNWYLTDTLNTLGPRYVSAVDSGNLAGHLVAVSSALREWEEAPSAHMQGSVEGLADVLGILQEVLKDLPDDRKTVRPLRRRLSERLDGFASALAAVRREKVSASIHIIDLLGLARDIEKLARNLDHEVGTTQSSEVLAWARSLVLNCEAHKLDSEVDISNIEPLRQRLAFLRDKTRGIAFGMDFSFLFRRERRLLSIGYRVDTAELDEGCYDLLASEARLTSLFAIAKGDLPTEHWYKLGRQVVPVGSRGALVSWSGSMFEYLMPPLVMQERQGGILNQTNNLVVVEQMNHGKRLGTPWGISEAAFNARDHELTYQYTNFGVPSLGLKRGLGENAVIAPYASLLASQYYPEAALANLKELRRLGALGRYGFHDAVDFTPTRVPEGSRCAVVENYMAHHHGMSIAAVANVVFNGMLRELFHSDPVIEAAELLIEEKAPREVKVMSAKQEPSKPGGTQADLARPQIRTILDPAERERELVFLSNGHYSVMLGANGAGYSRWNGQCVTRWKPDPTEDRWGSFIFLRDMSTHQWWSATTEPRRVEGEKASVIFGDDKAEFTKVVGKLTSELECIVATEHDAEGRRITLINMSQEDRFIEVTSYMEPVLSTEDADNAHPLFSRMFLKTEIGKRGDVIRAVRNKRNPSEPDMWVAHLMVDSSGAARPTEFETDRRRFIGRGRSLPEAAAFDPGAKLSGTDGFTLDPILSIRRVIRVPAGKKVSVIYWTIAAPSRAEIDAAIDRYRHPDAFSHEMVHAWTRAQVQMRHIGVNSKQAAAFQLLGRYLVYPDMHLRADPSSVEAGLRSQAALWPLAISGDYPIIALRINDEMDLGIAREALMAQEYLRSRGLVADLVIVNERASSYAQDMQHALDAACENFRRLGQADGLRQHIFAVRRDLMDADTWHALLAAARVVFHAANGTITDQINRAVALFAPPVKPVREIEAEAVVNLPVLEAPISLPIEDLLDLDYWNGFGGFSRDGSKYVIRLRGGQATPQPWINVIANASFGFHVAGEGGGFTWSRNSRDYQLTPWTNDPVVNRPGEAFYIKDVETGATITPFAALSRDQAQVFETRHGHGYSVFTTGKDGLEIELLQTVDPERPIKISRLRIRNRGQAARRLRGFAYVEWVLGNNPQKTHPYVITSRDEETGALFATNPYSLDYSGRTAFLAARGETSGHTTSRREFIGKAGSIHMPTAILSGQALSNRAEFDGDPAAALSVDFTLSPGEERDLYIYLGDAADAAEARSLLRETREQDFETVLKSVHAFWNGFKGTVSVKTPDRAFDLMVNGWLPYQALSCRIRARAAFYQASGAYGFRDQLQDTLAFLLQDPSLARAQILNAAGRQFIEGDVQHWWLPQTGAGVRTLISDDVVWLAYAVHAYCEATGDLTLLDEEVSFIAGEALAPGQHDSFYRPETSGETGTVYEHAARGLDLAILRTAESGLPLILGGDWNDGMNRVGIEGRGTSVWLGWLLAGTLQRFLPFARVRHDAARVGQWEAHLSRLTQALEKNGWDGTHYRRGTFDDGTPLGSDESEECRIDSIAQSWSVLSGLGNPERQRLALDAVMQRLVDREKGLIKLFTPPFETAEQDPGYIKAYPPGVRENGGQYTHAATWVVLALAALGRGDDAYRCFSMLNPVNHALDAAEAETYRVEPYVVAADVYGEGALSRRGGWTWYTGSAGWLYRAAVEGILGVTRRGDLLRLKPALPSTWDRVDLELSLGTKTRRIAMIRKHGAIEVSVDGAVLEKPEEGFLI
jgi:cyclic beta-1,2-glucan synthetase